MISPHLHAGRPSPTGLEAAALFTTTCSVRQESIRDRIACVRLVLARGLSVAHSLGVPSSELSPVVC